MKRVAAYCVSTAGKPRQGNPVNSDQTPELQEQSLQERVTACGRTVRHVDSDRKSGAKEHRLGLGASMHDTRRVPFEGPEIAFGNAPYRRPRADWR